GGTCGPDPTGPQAAQPAACDLAPAQLTAARQRARQAAAALISGAALQIREHTYELIILNPRKPQRGTVRVSLDNGGFVSWHHPCQSHGDGDFFGHPEGIASDHDDDHTPRRSPPGARPHDHPPAHRAHQHQHRLTPPPGV
ncbi:MAG: hypothetical protein ACRDNF_24380, partial [Streptosporangiaceae bacterium]